MAANDQHLKHGKALCGKVFGRFVETFNALVDFMLGLRGDAEGKNGEGHITYDRKNNIIRCDGCGGKGGGSGSVAKIPGCFEIRRPSPAASEGGEGGFSLINRYYYVGSKVYELEENRTYHYKDTFVCLIIDMSGPTCSASVAEFQSITSLRNEATENENIYIVPLYHIGHNFEVLCDMRNIPGAASWEFDA